VTETQTLTPPTPTATAVEGSDGLLLEIDGQIVPNYDATMVPFEEGDVVSGKVVRIDQDEVLVDIGYKSEGVILSNELSIRKSVDPHDEVELGEEVDALVLTKEDQDGRLLLSKKRARFEKAWRRIEAAAESGEPVEGNVIEVVKGGLIIDLGVRGFLPASLVDIRRVQDLDEFMGQKIECKVIELNRSRNNVVLSRRAVLEEERKEVRQQILDRLQPGQVVEGSISNIVDFGAFVDLDGIDGLIHISELSWSHVNHPSEILSIGDTVPVKVLDIDRDRQRISLGLKQTQEDPWQRVVDTYNINDELEGKVTKVVTFGAFVEILDGVEGLVHISELAHHHVENPREVVEPGATVKVKVLEIDSERRRLSLSIKRVAGNEPPPPTTGGSGSTLGSIPDIGLSDDDLRAVVVATSEDSDDEEEAAAPEADAAPAAEVDVPEADAAPAAEVDVPEADAAPAAEVEVPEAEVAATPEAPEATDEAPADESAAADDSASAEDASEADGDAADAADAAPETDERQVDGARRAGGAGSGDAVSGRCGPRAAGRP
jgi:small subunit ribosomal protein S1